MERYIECATMIGEKIKMRFVTLSPECRNIELVKDVGQIPYVLGAEHDDIETSIIACDIKEDGPNLQNVPGLNLIHIKKLFRNTALTGVVYLLFHARKIDWLSMHHAGRRSYYWTRLYKLLNHKGKAYLKLDLDYRSCDMYDSDKQERKIFEKNMKVMNLVTVESQSIKERIQKYSCQEIEVLGNGYCKTESEPDILQEREGTFITVGRLGTQQKATEILLEAFAKSAKEHSWKLKLVGTIDKGFEHAVDSFFSSYPELRQRVVFTGEIKSRHMLYDEYCKAKVFILASRWESFGIVSVEALACGCRLIVSDQVPPAKEMTRDGEYGQIVPADNVEALKDALVKATKEQTGQDKILEIKEYANKQFSWSFICDLLHRMLIDR